ncbi:response regulator [Olivibacter sp. XZL3]|uniref:response regulator n=1 Tax=Olivibacter sp. XZL3 TaxID=1735116 RepID=UPI001066C922|nr:response regulator [Olivibacter sp. XZL3]
MRKLVYILEDEEDIRDILSIFLSEHAEVKTFANIKSFKEAMLTVIPHLFLLDINLPDGNGLELAMDISNNLLAKNKPIVIMSAHMRNDDLQQRKEISAFISKPFDLSLMERKVVELLDAS